ncbi:hypothetical protein [Fusobacterium sp.]|uniref:hypothetical protein n=1 Tax=Fusobacterium sp. TaxID=68766 RepID=UPI00396CB570
MDARNDNARNINYKCIIRHSDGTEEELSENLTYEELMDFLKNYEGENGTANIEGSTSEDEYADWDEDERCPMCGSTDIDELERGKVIGSVTGGALGFTRKEVIRSFLPNIVARGVGGVIGYAVGYAAGKVLDKKLLNNRKCTHCGYEWHEDEDIF